MNNIKVTSVNISKEKGTIKLPVEKIFLNKLGVENDAHSGNWHRQVSMLAEESIAKFSKQANRKINYGEFAENITTKGIILNECNIFDRFKIGVAELELTQIGKDCHGNACSIFKEVGNCVMPKEGIFCRVLHNGVIKAEDEIIYLPKIFKIAIITLSDRASNGVYEDRSGPKVKELISSYFSEKNNLFSIENFIIPDETDQLKELISEKVKNNFDFIFTTGGTGIGERDITVETVCELLEKQIPGIMELIRVKYGMEKPNALLSRGVAGTIAKTIIFTLPGSVKGVTEYLTEITKTLEHLLYMIHGIDKH